MKGNYDFNNIATITISDIPQQQLTIALDLEVRTIDHAYDNLNLLKSSGVFPSID